MAGLIGFAGVVTLDGFTWGVLGEISGRPGWTPARSGSRSTRCRTPAWSLPYYLAGLGYIPGC